MQWDTHIQPAAKCWSKPSAPALQHTENKIILKGNLRSGMWLQQQTLWPGLRQRVGFSGWESPERVNKKSQNFHFLIVYKRCNILVTYCQAERFSLIFMCVKPGSDTRLGLILLSSSQIASDKADLCVELWTLLHHAVFLLTVRQCCC